MIQNYEKLNFYKRIINFKKQLIKFIQIVSYNIRKQNITNKITKSKF